MKCSAVPSSGFSRSSGADGDRIRLALAGRSVEFVVNPDPEGDMLDRCAEDRAVPNDCDAARGGLGRSAGHYGRGRRRGSPSLPRFRPWNCSADLQRPPRPSNSFLHVLSRRDLSQFQQVGLRGLLHAIPATLPKVAAAAPGVVEDMDLPEDYRQALSARLIC